MGGWSSEREVSLMSGKGVAEALQERGWTNVTRGRHGPQRRCRSWPESGPTWCSTRCTARPGEDGTVQGMLDLMQIPYTHSGLETSVIAIDKELTKMVLVPARHPHAQGRRWSTARASTRATRWRGPMC